MEQLEFKEKMKHLGKVREDLGIGEGEGAISLPKTQACAIDQDEKIKERNTRNSGKKLSD